MGGFQHIGRQINSLGKHVLFCVLFRVSGKHKAVFAELQGNSHRIIIPVIAVIFLNRRNNCKFRTSQRIDGSGFGICNLGSFILNDPKYILICFRILL